MALRTKFKSKIDEDLAILTLFHGCGTKREGMLIKNSSDTILQQIVNIKTKNNALPITMRKLYAYKMAEAKKEAIENNMVPLVLRKRMYYETIDN